MFPNNFLPMSVKTPFLKTTESLISAFLSLRKSRLNKKMISRYELYIGVAVSSMSFVPSMTSKILRRTGVSFLPASDSFMSSAPAGASRLFSASVSVSDPISRKLCASSMMMSRPEKMFRRF